MLDVPYCDHVYLVSELPDGFALAGVVYPCANREARLLELLRDWNAWAESVSGWVHRYQAHIVWVVVPAGIPMPPGVDPQTLGRAPRALGVGA